jgi:hypothetical protein
MREADPKCCEQKNQVHDTGAAREVHSEIKNACSFAKKTQLAFFDFIFFKELSTFTEIYSY